MSGAADDNTERVDRVDESEGDLQRASEVEGQPAVDGDASGSTAPPAPDANGAELTPNLWTCATPLRESHYSVIAKRGRLVATDPRNSPIDHDKRQVKLWRSEEFSFRGRNFAAAAAASQPNEARHFDAGATGAAVRHDHMSPCLLLRLVASTPACTGRPAHATYFLA